MKVLFTLAFCLIAVLVFAQAKIEKEYGVASEEVPEVALNQVLPYFPSGLNIKWFREESESGTSYEAKFAYKSHIVSIEFSENGLLEDTEVKVRWKEVKPETREKIEQYFSDNYRRYKIYKVQRQYLQPLEKVSQYLQNDKPEAIEHNFEIEFYGKENRKELWEGLFDQSGNCLSKRKIILKPTDHLQY